MKQKSFEQQLDSPYNVKEFKRYVTDIRDVLNNYTESIDDTTALKLIEDYIFALPKSRCCSHIHNKQLINKLFLKLRKEMDILQPYVDDQTISEIMVNGKDDIFIERDGQIHKVNEHFDTVEDLEELIRRIAAKVHREINELNPIVDARLSDGSRVNAVYRSVALNGPILTIRKFPDRVMQMNDLLDNGTLPKEAASLLINLVQARYNIFVSGGTSSGKTTLLNVLSQYIPPDERVIVIEDSAELQIKQLVNIVRLECKQANIQGKGQVDMTSLVKTSLRMRPDRIIVGEVRGGEVVDMIQAMNTGHAGSMSTGHANNIPGMIKRLEAMFMQAVNFPVTAIRSQIAEGIDIMVHLSKTSAGRRCVTEISEVIGVYDNEVKFNCLYKYETGMTGNQLLNKDKLNTSKYRQTNDK